MSEVSGPQQTPGNSALLDQIGSIKRTDLWKILSYNFEELKFADQKATALLGISNLITTVVNYFLINANLNTPQSALLNLHISAKGRDGFILGAVVSGNAYAILATVCSILAICPRVKRNSLIHFAEIERSKTPQEYLKKIRELKEGAVEEQLATAIHRMAEVAQKKYKWIGWAVWWAALEFIFLLVGLTVAIASKYMDIAVQ